MTIKLDISPLENATNQIEQSLNYYHSDLAKQDPGLALQLRAASIQAFEFTYELCWKMLKRYLEISAPSLNNVDALAFPELIRSAAEQGLLLHGWPQWKIYREARNIISHTYNQAKAKQVMEIIPQFLEEAKYLSAQLANRIVQS